MVERVTVRGVVQGVGFRPFVHRLATELALDGEVGNDTTGVFIVVSGPQAVRDELVRRITADAPPLARVDAVERALVDAAVAAGFRIVESRAGQGERTLVPPDTAVCPDCLHELFDPGNRRFRHPFITCTNCGPRFTIIRSLPYDRQATTMADFEMCDACAAEYTDPTDRRYHAQPIGCHDCGPRLSCSLPGDPIAATVDAVLDGATVAVKGLGGFHLMCDATSDAAVALLRERKRRPDRPFAVMVPDVAAAGRIAHVTDVEAGLLRSPANPIVLVRSRDDSPISRFVAPGNPLVAVMLPSTPAHHLLLDTATAHGRIAAVVCTSGNRSGEPIVHRDADVDVLRPLADAVLTHDRPIELPCDDSVVRVVADRLLPIRRGRGYAPVPVPIERGRRSVLAVGGELKSACCVATHDQAWVGQHIGEHGTLATLDAFERTAHHLARVFDVTPEIVAVDAHPDYASARWARRMHGDCCVEVQHHHAHVASVMAEHRLDPNRPVLGIVFDGTGYGTDGTIWGGEALVATADTFDRVAHLAPIPLPGGDAAIANPYRVALAHLHAAGLPWDERLTPVGTLRADGHEQVLARQLETGVACVPTTSMGRLFDAVAALVGLRQRISFEAQAAIELELAAAAAGRVDRGYRFGTSVHGGVAVADPTPVVRSVRDDVLAGVEPGVIGSAFHVAVVELVADWVAAFRHRADHVVVSGGVFQNALLTEWTLDRLRREDVVPLTHHLVPPNDGGLALGQAFVAAHSTFPGEEN